MSSSFVLLLVVQAFLIQNTFSQYFGPFNPAFNRNQFGYGNVGYDTTTFGRPIADGIYNTWPASVYGGSGIGNVAITADMPVGGNTIIGAKVPIIGAVQFGGEAIATGAVCISAKCGCGCGCGSPLLI